ncbi:MAG: sensor domain-containing phosphodiesterase [Herminiimonas sp.]|uniref:putative bifunctional diguanylate cyclase/phosphodiesterase n=1 Tax=Herminiimonas sp. TaxID=1926289 RepID=UPI0027224D23|nr:sensor domain-containing phosphodiesterase [Herminiimonas sp.]MDO9420847.1 sensor domain-containing phosphodiesterase [Herminiimonas sp.]
MGARNQVGFLTADLIPDENARVDALRNLDLLDTPSSEAFDRITRLAAKLFNLPISAVSLTDTNRQWFKSRVGVAHQQIPRDRAPCAQVADTSAPVVIHDLLIDPFYRESLLAESGIRFYAGAPLITDDGYSIGAMCVLGMEPRGISTEELAALTDMAAMVMTQIELKYALGRIDPVSNLPNRNQFKEDLDDLVLDRRGEPAHLVMINIARPDEISAAARVMGSSYLEDMVKETATILKAALGKGRSAYHVAETQFVFFAPPDIELSEYRQLLVQTLHAHRAKAESRFVTTTTVGIAPFVIGELSSADILRRAHCAAQDALDDETHVSAYSQDHDDAYERRFLLLNKFGAALENLQRLNLVYQPRIDIASGNLMGVEALLRWTDPELGVVSPGEFMPVIEQSSMARAVTEWVLNTAICQLGSWQREGLSIQLSINISVGNLLEPDFTARLMEMIDRHGVQAKALELEITESAMMFNPAKSYAVMETIAKSGIRFAIDDFGTGYSSLAYLQSLPAHVVKIDQSFMKNMLNDVRKRSLVTTMIKLSHDLGYRVVAEGVETQDVLQFLAAADCDEVQGYYFARPMLASLLSDWSTQHH